MYNFDFNLIINNFRLNNYKKFFATSNVIIKFIVERKFFFTTTTVEFDFRYFNKKCFYFIVVMIIKNFVLNLFFMISFFRVLIKDFFKWFVIRQQIIKDFVITFIIFLKDFVKLILIVWIVIFSLISVLRYDKLIETLIEDWSILILIVKIFIIKQTILLLRFKRQIERVFELKSIRWYRFSESISLILKRQLTFFE